MTKKNDLYKCQLCTNIIEVYQEGSGELVCHNQPMKLLAANTTDAAHEKHVPVFEKVAEGWLVKIGSVPHPMIAEHYIELIEVFTDDGKIGRKYLKPGDKPEAVFHTKANITMAREYCNIHGLWGTK